MVQFMAKWPLKYCLYFIGLPPFHSLNYDSDYIAFHVGIDKNYKLVYSKFAPEYCLKHCQECFLNVAKKELTLRNISSALRRL